MQMDCDKAIMVSLKHDDKLPDGSEFAFQVNQNFCQAIVCTVFYSLNFIFGFVLIVVFDMLPSVPFFIPLCMGKEEFGLQLYLSQ